MIFVVRPDNNLKIEDLVKLHDRLEAELNSDIENKVTVIPADCEYDIIAEDSEHPVKVRDMLS